MLQQRGSLKLGYADYKILIIASEAGSVTNRRAERAPHLSYSGGKSSSYIYICFLYIYIYIYTSVRRARAVNARATRKRRTGRLRFNGQYNRLENGYFSSKL